MGRKPTAVLRQLDGKERPTPHLSPSCSANAPVVACSQSSERELQRHGLIGLVNQMDRNVQEALVDQLVNLTSMTNVHVEFICLKALEALAIPFVKTKPVPPAKLRRTEF